MNRLIAAIALLVSMAAVGCDSNKPYVFTVEPGSGFTPADGAELLKQVESALPRAKFERRIVTRPNRKVVWIVTDYAEARDRIEKALRADPKLRISRIERTDVDDITDN